MKIKLIIISIILFIIPIPAVLFIIIGKNKEIKIYPNKSEFYIKTIADDYYDGNSKILKYNDTGNKIELRYILKEGFGFPYAGITFDYEDEKGIDISKYNNVEIKLYSPDTEEIDIRMLYYIDSSSKREIYASHLIKSSEIKISKHPRAYNININKFEIPQWYFFLNKKVNLNNIEDLKKLKSLSALEIFNCQSQALDEESTLFIDYIGLNNKYPHLFYTIFFIFILSYYLLLLILIIFKKQIKKLRAKFNLVQKHLDVASIGDKELGDIIKYTQENYNKSDITINDISKMTGTTTRKISMILKKNFKMSFRQYLNKIRVEEAKHLITNTDRQLTEIAFYIGYNNSTHFYRIFKEITGLSPKDYMLKNRKDK